MAVHVLAVPLPSILDRTSATCLLLPKNSTLRFQIVQLDLTIMHQILPGSRNDRQQVDSDTSFDESLNTVKKSMLC
jgi:hypothetical protein